MEKKYDFKDTLINNISLSFIDKHDIVSKIKAIDLIESKNRYNNNRLTHNYFQRVNLSLSSIESNKREIALLLFANVFYLPSNIMKSTWKNIWMEIKDEFGEYTDINNIHIFGMDSEPFSTEFLRENQIIGRLDSDKNSRISTIEELAEIILRVSDGKELNQHKKSDISILRNKKIWLLLSDKIISGTSIISELRRIKPIANWFQNDIKVIIGCQVITDIALDSIKNTNLIDEKDIYYGIKIPERMSVNSNKSDFHENGLSNDIEDLCNWFAKKYIIPDARTYGRMCKSSGDNLEFGYKKCGLLYIDQINSPTGSLPILWHSCNEYIGPFPRVHSRIGSGKMGTRDNVSFWEKITEIINIKPIKMVL